MKSVLAQQGKGESSSERRGRRIENEPLVVPLLLTHAAGVRTVARSLEGRVAVDAWRVKYVSVSAQSFSRRKKGHGKGERRTSELRAVTPAGVLVQLGLLDRVVAFCRRERSAGPGRKQAEEEDERSQQKETILQAAKL